MSNFRIEQETFVELVALKVKEIEKQINFYHDILKFDILSEENGMVFLGIKETKESLLVLLEVPNGVPSPYSHNGLNHIGLVVSTREQLSQIYRHLMAVDYPIYEMIDHGNGESILVKDPELNLIEIYWDNPATNQPILSSFSPLDEASLLSESEECAEYNFDKMRVGHVQLNVGDIEKSLDFYKNMLGFYEQDIKFRSMKYLTAGNSYHHISLKQRMQLKNEVLGDKYLGLDYISFFMKDEESLNALKANLEEMNVSYFYNKGKHILQTDDPNGIHIWFRIKPNYVAK